MSPTGDLLAKCRIKLPVGRRSLELAQRRLRVAPIFHLDRNRTSSAIDYIVRRRNGAHAANNICLLLQNNKPNTYGHPCSVDLPCICLLGPHSPARSIADARHVSRKRACAAFQWIDDHFRALPETIDAVIERLQRSLQHPCGRGNSAISDA